MLNLYYGRESVDKEKFMYQEIRRRGWGINGKQTFILVPDQYTVEGERQAFRYLEADSLIGLDFYSISRLGKHLLTTSGTGLEPGTEFIDKYGRQMLLTRILRAEKENLEVYRSSADKSAFVEMVNDFISEMKQYDITPEDLNSLIPQQTDDLLRRKLADLSLICHSYEAAIAGKYTDSEDLIDLYAREASHSGLLSGSRVWVYGFDSFAPKMRRVLMAILQNAEELNVLLTLSDKKGRDTLFPLTDSVRRELIRAAQEQGSEIGEVWELTKEDEELRPPRKSPGIQNLEERLYQDLGPGRTAPSSRPNLESRLEDAIQQSRQIAWPGIAASPSAPTKLPDEPETPDSSGITILRAANPQSEAESAAAFVKELVRDRGMRYRDIGLIVNDQENMGGIVQRVFEEYGLPVFRDSSRSILDSGIAVFLISLLNAASGSWRTSDILAALKTDFSPLTPEETEMLETYVNRYRIRGNMWKNPFTRGKAAFDELFPSDPVCPDESSENSPPPESAFPGITTATTEEKELSGFERIEKSRSTVAQAIEKLQKLLKRKQTLKEFLSSFFSYLREDLHLPEKIDELAQRQEDIGRTDLAEETRQVWGFVLHVFDQMVSLSGEEPFDREDFLNTFSFGLSQIEIGILPTSVDDIAMGTMQRSRFGSIKALLVIGVNEGVLPQNSADNGIFSQRELETIRQEGMEICKSDPVRVQEERLAIYRNLSKPTEELWLSYSLSNTQGAAMRPSSLIEDVREIFPNLQEKLDVISSDDPLMLVQSPQEALNHLTEALNKQKYDRKDAAPEKTAARGREIWSSVRQWFREKDPASLQEVERALHFRGSQEKLDRMLIHDLLPKASDGAFLISASRLENYSSCPFRYFVDYDLRAAENREYEASPIEFGELYHDSIREITDRLETEGLWESILPEEADTLVQRIIEQKTASYQEGLFQYTGREKYLSSRLEEVCQISVKALIAHMRMGRTAESRHEEPFGPGCSIGPVHYKAGDNDFLIKGIIDRYDILENGRVKIIDYKSSNKKANEEQIRGGIMLQLMIYGKALEGAGRKLAGIFYFHIHEPEFQRTSLSGKEQAETLAEKKTQEDYRMSGILINDRESLLEIDGSLSETGAKSNIIKMKEKDGEFLPTSTDSLVMSDDEFTDFENEFDRTVTDICENLSNGFIPAHPYREGSGVASRTACDYCPHKNICKFDNRIDGFTYNVLK